MTGIDLKLASASDEDLKLPRNFDADTGQWNKSLDGSFWKAIKAAHKDGLKGANKRIVIIDAMPDLSISALASVKLRTLVNSEPHPHGTLVAPLAKTVAPDAEIVARRIGNYFSGKGFPICNGLADGIDFCSVAPDDTMLPAVIGVMAAGLDLLETKLSSNRATERAARVLDADGLLVSGQLSGNAVKRIKPTSTLAWMFRAELPRFHQT